ncbi:MAG: hypothetical protein ABL993_02430 [Vicinamibacterales bacterium]
MADNRTGTAVQKVVDAVQEDIGEIVDLLTRGLAKMRDLEGHARGINGLASILKGKSAEVELIVSVLKEESERVASKMLAEPRAAIREAVDEEKAAEVRKARRADQ